MPRLMQKTPVPPNLTRSEQKAAEIDSWVKGHIAELREADKEKRSRLKALREAREAAESRSGSEAGERSAPRRAKRARRIWVSGPETPNESKAVQLVSAIKRD